MLKNTIRTATVLISLASLTAFAADRADQKLNLQVQPFVNITVADASLNLVITSIPQGNQGEATASSSYALVNNVPGKKITANLDTDMPHATMLWVTAEEPTVSRPLGSKINLSTSPKTVAREVGSVNQAGFGLYYSFKATEFASTSPFVRTVTYTVLND